MTAASAFVLFQLNGIEYRTDGKIVEAEDGQKWNKTGLLSVVLVARKIFAASGAT